MCNTYELGNGKFFVPFNKNHESSMNEKSESCVCVCFFLYLLFKWCNIIRFITMIIEPDIDRVNGVSANNMDKRGREEKKTNTH